MTAARRAMFRWAWRLFRREWRRHALILAMLAVAVAAMTVGLGVITNVSELKADAVFGTANTMIVIPGSDASLASDVSAVRDRFGAVDVIAHRSVAIPGSVSSLDVRAQDPRGTYGSVMLRLDAGRYPTGPGEAALTSGTAKTFGLHLGSVWKQGDRSFRVVGLIENPLNLGDQFALVAPGEAGPPDSITLLVSAGHNGLQSWRLPSGTGIGINSRGTPAAGAAAGVVLVVGSLGLLFVGLMSVAGFTVMAQRRMRALGMLGAVGATDRHVRMVMLADGAAVGATAAVIGTVAGFAVWLALVPAIESVAGHRIDRFALPWLAVIASMVLAFATAVVSAWWPARAVARVPIVAALSGRPPRPQPGHRFAAGGGVLLCTGLVLLAFADSSRAGFIISGTVVTVVGLLFLAPLGIRALAGTARRSPVSVRLAVRDLARYQARSGAALGAVTLAVGIAATIAVSAAAAETTPAIGNLPSNEINIHINAGDPGTPVQPLTAEQRDALQGQVDALAANLHGLPGVPLEFAYAPQGGLQSLPTGQAGPPGYTPAALAKVDTSGQGTSVTEMVDLYVATPAVLSRYGISPSEINPAADVLTSVRNLAGLQIFSPGLGPREPRGSGMPILPPGAQHPNVEILSQLPRYGSEPVALITQGGMQRLGLVPTPVGWLVQAPRPLTTAQIATAREAAAGAGLHIETRHTQKSLAPLRNWSTAAGILVALGVLGMTVGLIRSETAGDLRTLAATGASSITRRFLTGVTAGALAFLGAFIGSAGAYAALLAWHRSNLGPLSRVPVLNLVIILIGLPAIATAGGCLLAGREPPAIARRPID